MKDKNATEWIANYIKKQGFSIEQIAFGTGVSKEKLHEETNEELTIEEFFKVCIEIGITPEQVQEEMGK